MKRYSRLYLLLVGQYFKTELAYPRDFVLWLIIDLLKGVIRVAFIGVLLQSVGSLRGWTQAEVYFLLGLATLSLGLFNIFFFNLFSLEGYIQDGQLDYWLTRPVNPLFQLVSDRLDLDNCGALVIGITLLSVSAPQLALNWTLVRVLWTIAVVLQGTLVLAGSFLAVSSLSFWLKERASLTEPFYALSEFSRYPTTVFNPWLQTVLTWIIPYAFVAFIPITPLLRPSAAAWKLAIVSPCVTAGLLVLGYVIWILGLRRYESSGS